MIKKALKKIVTKAITLFSNISIGRYINNLMLKNAMLNQRYVSHNGINLSFVTPNPINEYRAESFSTKEPETLEWIDGFENDSIFWDIGANVGLYSCYAASKKNSNVIAFEPSVFNLELLARNIFNNQLIDRITIMPLAISDKQSLSKLNLSSTQWGGALSTFGETYGQDGKDLDIEFAFNTFGISMDIAHEVFKLPLPKYLKIDVDGIEHLILQGGKLVLDSVQEILVEINEGFAEQDDLSSQILKDGGFKLLKRGEYVYLDKDNSEKICNQIWTK